MSSSTAEPAQPATPPPRPSSRSLWIAVGLAFGLLLAAWCTLIILASRNRVQEVPLSTPPASRQ